MPVNIFCSIASFVILLVISAGAYSAPLYPSFTVNEGAIPGAVNHQLVANQIDFSYSSTLTIRQDGTFTQTGALSVSSFKMVDDVTGTHAVGSQLNIPESLLGGAGYQLGAIFSASGTTSPTSYPSGVLDTYDNFSLSMMYDADQDGTYDGTLGTASLGGLSTLFLDLDSATTGDGDFSVNLDLMPSVLGLDYFISLSPFYQTMLLTGNNRIASVKIGPDGEIIYELTGSGNITFHQKVPEPTSSYLAALGMLLLVTRRYQHFSRHH